MGMPAKRTGKLSLLACSGSNPGKDPSRLVARTASFCAERSGHYDNYDQV